jgi:hypothetical protein
MENPSLSLLNDEWAASFKEICSCERGTVPLFYCNVENCPELEQTLYCHDCALIDEKHNHKNVKIKHELETRMNEWKIIVENVKSLK